MPNHIMSVFWRNPEIDVDELAKALKGLDEETVQTILAYMPKRKQQMFSSVEQPLSKKEINKSQLTFVQLARSMGQSGDLSLDDVLSTDDDDLVE